MVACSTTKSPSTGGNLSPNPVVPGIAACPSQLHLTQRQRAKERIPTSMTRCFDPGRVSRFLLVSEFGSEYSSEERHVVEQDCSVTEEWMERGS